MTMTKNLLALMLACSGIANAQEAASLESATLPPGPFAEAQASPLRYTQTPVLAALSCRALETVALEPRTLDKIDLAELKIQASLIPASMSAPEHCRVSLQAMPALRMEINLPRRWNARFYMMGNGGSAGESADEPTRREVSDRALRNGFVTASTNTGHDRTTEPSYSFASDPRKLVDYGYRAVHVTAETAKRLILSFYGQAVQRSYWDSCSTGGREGLMEAQRFPDDFDGLIVGAPALDFSGLLIQHIWIQRIVDQTPLSVAKVNLVGRAVYAKCDVLDGLTDGLIADPQSCHFDPAHDVAQCRAGEVSDNCLTAAEAEAFRLIDQGPRAAGHAIFPGLAPGAELPSPDGRKTGWDIGADGLVVGGIDVAESQLRNAVFNDPGYDWHQFDLGRDLPKLDVLRRLVDATNPDLSTLRHRGGKVLMYYGWADTILNPRMGIHFYEAVRKASGANINTNINATINATTDDFFRLFMVPGMFHCRGGYGPDRFDAMTAIVNWVESGKAPERIVASQVVKENIVRTRPLCPYPQLARYNGQGAVDQAESFTCTDPAKDSHY